MVLDADLYDLPAPGACHLARLSNVVGVAPEPFDPETYVPAASADYVDDRGLKRAGVSNQHTIRRAAGRAQRAVPGGRAASVYLPSTG